MVKVFLALPVGSWPAVLRLCLRCRWVVFIAMAGLACQMPSAAAVTISDDMPRSPDRPNMVVMLADDFGWGDVGAFWNETLDTPNLDMLASSGVRLLDFHSAASVCAPSRASLLTGRMGLRNGVIRNFEPSSVAGLPLTEITLAELFKENGYQTGMIGKWHLGTNGPFHPRNRGFDFYYGIPYSNDMGCTDYPGYNLPMCLPCPLKATRPAGELPLQHESQVQTPPINCDKWNSAVPLYSNYDIIEQPVDLRTLASRYASNTEVFLEQRNKSAPFLLYVAFAHMHVPLQHSQAFANSSRKGTVFADTLRELDSLVGDIVAKLTKEDVAANTLVWFAGDNGPWDRKCNLTGSPGPFVGRWQKTVGGGGATMKQTTWEGGHRQVGIVAWPGHVAPATSSNALTSTLDIMPTLASIAGITLPTDRQYDGMDISSVLTNSSTAHRNADHSEHLTRAQVTLRNSSGGQMQLLSTERGSAGGHEFLFHPNSGVGIHGALQTVRYGQYKARFVVGSTPDCQGKQAPVSNLTTPQLFDLAQDPAESTPLAGEEYEPVLAKIATLLDSVLYNISIDMTSRALYAKDEAAKPCCNEDNAVCRCDP